LIVGHPVYAVQIDVNMHRSSQWCNAELTLDRVLYSAWLKIVWIVIKPVASLKAIGIHAIESHLTTGDKVCLMSSW